MSSSSALEFEEQKQREYRKLLWTKESEKLKERVGNVIAQYRSGSPNVKPFEGTDDTTENIDSARTDETQTVDESFYELDEQLYGRKHPESLKYKSLAEIDNFEMQKAYENALKEKELLMAKHCYLRDQMNQLDFTDNIFISPSFGTAALHTSKTQVQNIDASNGDVSSEKKGSLLFNLHNILSDEKKRNQSLMEELEKIKTRNRAFELEQNNKKLDQANETLAMNLKTKTDLQYVEDKKSYHSAYSARNADAFLKRHPN